VEQLRTRPCVNRRRDEAAPGGDGTPARRRENPGGRGEGAHAVFVIVLQIYCVVAAARRSVRNRRCHTAAAPTEAPSYPFPTASFASSCLGGGGRQDGVGGLVRFCLRHSADLHQCALPLLQRLFPRPAHRPYPVPTPPPSGDHKLQLGLSHPPVVGAPADAV